MAYDADVHGVLALFNQVAQWMYDEPEWRDRIIDPPEVLGVDGLSHNGMLIRIWIKTQPLQQWNVGREFRRRIRRALESNQIGIGTPQQALWYSRDPVPVDGAIHTQEDGQSVVGSS